MTEDAGARRATDRQAPETEPFELSDAEVDLIVEALRYLRSTLGREEADELGRIKALLAKLAAARAVSESGPRS